MCIDYKKLNAKEIPLPFSFFGSNFRESNRSCIYFLDEYLGYSQIEIALEDQEKTTFTCPFGTFAFRRIPLVYIMHLPLFKDAY